MVVTHRFIAPWNRFSNYSQSDHVLQGQEVLHHFHGNECGSAPPGKSAPCNILLHMMYVVQHGSRCRKDSSTRKADNCSSNFRCVGHVSVVAMALVFMCSQCPWHVSLVQIAHVVRSPQFGPCAKLASSMLICSPKQQSNPWILIRLVHIVWSSASGQILWCASPNSNF